jgi:hypothetical protein
MNNSRFDRLALLSGLLAVVLFYAGAALIGIYDYLPAAEKIADYLMDNAARVMAGGYLGSISAVFLIWFAGSVRSVLASYEGGNGRLSDVAFGGGLGASIALALGFTFIITAAARAGAEGGITAVGAITVHDLWGQILGYVTSLMLAVFIGATASISLRTDLFPNWFGWLSVLLAIGLLTPLNYIFIFPGTLWLLVISVWLYVRYESP